MHYKCIRNQQPQLTNLDTMTESLNIEYHVKRLVFIALNTSNTKVEASEKLKISERTLHTYIKMYDLVKQGNKWGFKN